jgi:hypothetical protein
VNEYTASNGIKIEWCGMSDWLVGGKKKVSLDQFAALREFFRAEEDARLERWRSPEVPDYLVYYWGQPTTAGVVVFCEVTGSVSPVIRRDADPENQSPDYRAARAYFDAHPEPKPAWHDAKEGEVWVITWEGNEYPAIFQADAFRDHGGRWLADDISAAHRIYPEGDS